MSDTLLQSLGYEWRKEAATGRAVDARAMERAFADQAFGYVANKAGPLMRDPYQLGFEIVFKNETNTRMVGIFAFRVNNALLYAPVFFVSGEIKGTDLLYHHTLKKFRPCNEDWVHFIMEADQFQDGSGVAASCTMDHRGGSRLDRIARPPMRKRASISAGEWDDLLEEMCLQRTTEPLLGSFLAANGQGAMEKLANLLDRHPTFADAMVRYLPEEEYLPAFPIATQEKQAEAKPEIQPGLHLYRDMAALEELPLEKRAAAAEQLSRAGYFLDDRRAEDAMSLVYVKGHDDLMQISEPGIHEMLELNGDKLKVLVGKVGNNLTIYSADRYPSPSESRFYNYEEAKCPPLQVVSMEGTNKGQWLTQYEYSAERLWGSPLVTGTADLAAALQDTPAVDQSWVAFDIASGEMSPPFHVISKEEKNGTTQLALVGIDCSDVASILINPDAETQPGVFGGTVKYYPVNTKKAPEMDSWTGRYRMLKGCDIPIQPAGPETVTQWALKKSPLKSMTLTRDPNDQISIGTDETRTSPEDFDEVVIKLAAVHHLPVAEAEEFASAALRDGKVSFLVWPPDGVKSAAAMYLNGDTPFQTDFNDEYGAQERSYQGFHVPIVNEVGADPPHRVGDAYDPTLGSGGNQDRDGAPMDFLMSATPQELEAYGEQQQLPHMFNHSALAALIGSYDAVAAQQEYIAKMEDGLDACGRCLFLFYAKPADYEAAYGSDDMRSIESRMLSVFKNFGDMLLELLKRSRKRRDGVPSL